MGTLSIAATSTLLFAALLAGTGGQGKLRSHLENGLHGALLGMVRYGRAIPADANTSQSSDGGQNHE